MTEVTDDVLSLSGAKPQRVRDMDFRRPMKFTRDQLRQLEHAHESFCRSASTRLSAELRTEVSLKLTSSDQHPYSTVMADEVPRQALVVILRADPIRHSFALVMEIPSVLRIVNRVLGGHSNSNLEDQAALTELEMAVAVRSVSGLVEALSATWSDLCGITFTAVNGDTSPVSVQLVPPSEPTLTLNFEVAMDDHTSTMTLILPYRSLSPVIEQLASNRDMDIDADDAAMGDINRALGNVTVDLRAEVGRMEMPLRELLKLTPGDVIKLPSRAEEGVVLRVGEHAQYRALPGTHAGNLAVQIIGPEEEQ